MDHASILQKLELKQDLSPQEATWSMQQMMDGRWDEETMSRFLLGMKAKPESITEIAACAQVMREKSTKVQSKHPLLLDTCGTGGDASGSFNISTTVALLLAGGGYPIAKHGNRSMSSQCGSADLLEALGLKIDLNPAQVGSCLDELGFGFLFAPAHHSSMKNVMPVRKKLATRTIFNILGPMTNPADAQVQVIGLFDQGLVPKLIRVLKELGLRSAFVVAGHDGMDEISLSATTQVAQLTADGQIQEFVFDPKDYGFTPCHKEDLQGGSPQTNADITRAILRGVKPGPMQEVVALNAGFAIAAFDQIPLQEAFTKAKSLIQKEVGIDFLGKIIKKTNSYA